MKKGDVSSSCKSCDQIQAESDDEYDSDELKNCVFVEFREGRAVKCNIEGQNKVKVKRNEAPAQSTLDQSTQACLEPAEEAASESPCTTSTFLIEPRTLAPKITIDQSFTQLSKIVEHYSGL